MTPKQRVIAQINHQETDFVPYRLAFETESIKHELDDFYGNALWQSALDNHIIYLEQPHAGLAIPDSTPSHKELWMDCFGGAWDITKRPAHIVTPPLSEPILKDYQFPDPVNCIKDGWVENSRRVIRNHPNHFVVARLGFGIFERSWAMRGFENSLMDAVVNDNFYEELLGKICDFQTTLLDLILKQIPVDGILFADDWGFQNGVLIGADRWRHFLKPHIEKLYRLTHQAGKYTLNHVCGSVYEIIPDLIEIGLDVLESVQPEAKGMNPYQLKQKFGQQITFFGGLGSQSIIQFGTPKQIHDEVHKLAYEMSQGGGYILAPAKPIQPGTPVENMAALVESFLLQAGSTL